MGDLEFSSVFVEKMGYLNKGKIKFSEGNVVFKNDKTSKVETIPSIQILSCEWMRLANKPGVKITLKDESVFRCGGFNEADFEKLKGFIKTNFKMELKPREPCVKGWNYGQVNFEGPNLQFEVGDQPCFEVPLANVVQCQSGKNESILEFQLNDDCPVSLMEMRFHIPFEEGAEDPVEEFRKNVLRYAGVEDDNRTPLVTLPNILCATPRGRYDIKIYPSHLSFHGKTFDYKINIKTILRLFLLPHKDGNHMFFVMSLDPPIRQGQTRYHFMVLEFTKDEEIDVELALTDDQLEEQFQGKLQRDLTGPVYEILSRIMRALVNQKITVPGGFVGHSGTPAVSCAYKQAAGYLYPLEKGFVFVHKPPMYIRFPDIGTVNFARSDVSTRSFDFEIESKNGSVHTFNSIEKEEYTRLYDFVEKKKLRIRNATKKLVDKPKYTDDTFSGSDDEPEHDAYAAKLKQEAKERERADSEEDSEDEDSDYNPDASPEKKKKKKRGSGSEGGSDDGSGGSSSGSGSEPDEEFDSNPDSSGAEAVDSDESDKEKKKKKKTHTAKTVKEPAAKKTKKGAKKDANAPKRGQSAYMLWFQANRSALKEPGMSVTDVAKKAGQEWKKLEDRSEWEKKAAEDKERYQREMQEYRKSAGGAASTSTKSSPSKKKEGSSPSKAKSKEYVSSSGSSSDDDKDDKKRKGKESDSDDSADDAPLAAVSKPKAPKTEKKTKKKESSSSEGSSSDDDGSD